MTIVGPDGQTTHLALDSNGHLHEVTNPAGERTTLTYDGNGLLRSFTDAKANAEGGQPHLFTYADGRLSADQDPLGNAQTLNYTPIASGFRVLHTTPLGRQTTYETRFISGIDESVTTDTDPAGLKTVAVQRPDHQGRFASPDDPTRLIYDSFGLLPDGGAEYLKYAQDPRFGSNVPFLAQAKTLLHADGTGLIQTRSTGRAYVLMPDGSVSSMIETNIVNGRTSTETFVRNGKANGIHKRTVVSPALRSVISYENDQGQLLGTERSGFFPSFLAYDAAGRLAHSAQGSDADCSDPTQQSSTPTCRRSAWTYFGSEQPSVTGFLKQVRDARGTTTDYQRDPVGRALVELRSGVTTDFGWDANGNLASVTPPGKPTHAMTYTPIDLLSSYQPPSDGLPLASTSYTYDADRMLRTEVRPNAVSVVRTPDNAGRVDTISIPGGLVDYDYYPAGTNGAGKTSDIRGPYAVNLHYAYDGRLTTNTTWSGAVNGSVSWQYNNDFIKTSETVAGATGSASAFFGYDADLLLTCASPSTCSPPGADALRLARDPGNGLLTGITLGNTSETLAYNGFGELARQIATFAPSTPLVDITYDAPGVERDALGRIVRKTEVIGGTTKVFQYTYDDLRRLTDVTINGSLAEHFEYDPNGNRTLGFNAAAGTTYTGTYDDQDRLLSYGPFDYTYTANGELETKTNRQTGESWILQYDALGNLLSVGLPNGDLLEYLVDGLGRRVGKKKNGVLLEQWVYRDTLKSAAEFDGSGGLIAEFVYGSKANVPDYVRRGGNTYRVISDELGSPRYVVNVANASDVPFTATYTSFGEVTGSGLDWMPFGFAGGQYDPETKLTRFGARDLDGQVGRWIVKDPIGLSAGTNLYVYVADDPLNETDEGGTQPIVTDNCYETCDLNNRAQVDECTDSCERGPSRTSVVKRNCRQECTDFFAKSLKDCYDRCEHTPGKCGD